MKVAPSEVYDGLISDVVPPVEVRGGLIAKISEIENTEITYKRGTIFVKSIDEDNLYILGAVDREDDVEGSNDDDVEDDSEKKLLPDCILCDDITIDISKDHRVPFYTAGCFNPKKVHVAEGYVITEDDLDILRTKNIEFRAVGTNSANN